MGWELAWWVIAVAILYVLVRPGSPAAFVAVALADAASGVIGAATGALFVSSSSKKKGASG